MPFVLVRYLCLVGGFNPSEKYESMGRIIPYYGKKTSKCLKPPTRCLCCLNPNSCWLNSILIESPLLLPYSSTLASCFSTLILQSQVSNSRNPSKSLGFMVKSQGFPSKSLGFMVESPWFHSIFWIHRLQVATIKEPAVHDLSGETWWNWHMNGM